MAEPRVAHRSIGEVLGLLLEEFPDITISKIRFLESQGLIAPERTASGYRKFYDADIELLRIILREQRERFLPLRVIKDRIDSGELEPPAEAVAKHPAASAGAGAGSSVRTSDPTAATRRPPPPSDADDLEPTPPSMRRPPTPTAGGRHDAAAASSDNGAARLLPGVLVNRDELCAMAGLTRDECGQLEDYGLITSRRGSNDLYGEDAVAIARAACGLLHGGVDVRHLRAWRTSVEREVGLFEQLVMPVLRQKNPDARAAARKRVDDLSQQGAALRDALMRAAIEQSLGL